MTPKDVRRRRVAIGLSQAKLGARVGVAQSIIARIESGQRMLTESMQRQIDRALREAEVEAKKGRSFVEESRSAMATNFGNRVGVGDVKVASKRASRPFLGGNLQRARLEAGMSKAELGWQLHTSYNAIRRWESGTSQPVEENVTRLAEVLKKPVEYFYEPLPAPEEVVTVGAAHHARDAGVAVDALAVFVNTLPRGDRERFLKLIIRQQVEAPQSPPLAQPINHAAAPRHRARKGAA